MVDNIKFKVGNEVFDNSHEYDGIRTNPTIITKINGKEVWCKDRVGESWLEYEKFTKIYTLVKIKNLIQELQIW